MNISSDGECSSQLKENGDSSDAERPLKKARFAWEVKGKHHLKDEFTDEMSGTKDASSMVNSITEDGSGQKEFAASTEQRLEIIGDYLFKQDFHTLESVITDPERSLLTPCTRVSTEVVSYPRYVATHELNGASSTVSSSSYRSVPMSSIINFDEDRCIARWQAGQMAKAFIDNSINRIIDVWSQVQFQVQSAVDDDPGWLAHRVADLVNNIPEDNSIENEGILMAISAHGLQNTSTSSSDTESQESTSSSDDDTNDTSSSRSNPKSIEVLEDIEHKNETNSTVEKPSDLLEIAYEDNISNLNNHINGYNRLSLNLPILDYNQDDTELFSSHDDIFANNHDFLDAAVSFAVQNKGLSSFGTEYG